MSRIIDKSVIQSFVEDCVSNYKRCCESVFKSSASKDLAELHRLARNGTIPYRTELEIGQHKLKLHIHGSGYTIEDAKTGLVTRFNVRQQEKSLTISFTSFDVQVYLKSNAKEIGLEELETWLTTNCSSISWIEHVSFNRASYFLVTELSKFAFQQSQS